jgi:hypothetical protein
VKQLAVQNMPDVDPHGSSLGQFLTVLFPKSRSSNYPAALKLAESADQYVNGMFQGLIYHCATFGKTVRQMELAIALIELVRGLKGVMVFSSGRKVSDTYGITRVAECCVKAARCNDWRAHCHKITSDVFERQRSDMTMVMRIDLDGRLAEQEQKHPERRYTFPCAFIYQYGRRISREHPSSFVDQLQAHAVGLDLEWCPYFEPSHFGELPVG